MSGAATGIAVGTPVGVALASVYWPQIRSLAGFRLRVQDTPEAPFRCLVLVLPDGRDWFISKLPSKDSE